MINRTQSLTTSIKNQARRVVHRLMQSAELAEAKR